jgi:hypothetical protein
LKAEEQESLRQLRQVSPQIEIAYQLVEAFLHMVRERTGEQLDAWLKAVQASHLEAFQSFVTGVQQDKDAVLAGLTLPWSTMLLLNAYHCHDHANLPRFSVRCILFIDIDDDEPGAVWLVAFLDMGVCMSTLFLDHDALDEIKVPCCRRTSLRAAWVRAWLRSPRLSSSMPAEAQTGFLFVHVPTTSGR